MLVEADEEVAWEQGHEAGRTAADAVGADEVEREVARPPLALEGIQGALFVGGVGMDAVPGWSRGTATARSARIHVFSRYYTALSNVNASRSLHGRFTGRIQGT